MREKCFMFRSLVLALFFTISLCGVSLALDLDYYMGGSLGYNAEEFSASSDNKNAYGFNMIAGTLINEKFACELQLEKILDFDTKNEVSEDDVDVRSYTFNIKYYPSQKKSNLQGYVRLGFGWMKNEVGDNGTAKSDNKEEEGLCMKLGGGCDFKVSEIITFFLEATYTEGYNDINPIDYFSGAIGLKLFPFAN